MEDLNTPDEHRTLALIQRAMRSHGIDVETDGDTAVFQVDDHRLRRRLSWLPASGALRVLQRSQGNPDAPVYLASRVTPSAARLIRAAGGWYADAAGNVHLRGPGVLVDVRGRSPLPASRPTASVGTSRNLMSAGRAQVIFAVLTWPGLLTCSLREIGEAAGVSTAAAHQTVQLLEEDRYLTRSRRLVRRDDLIDLWAASYPLGLARSAERGRYVGDATPDRWPALGHRVFVSGEHGTPGISGPDLVLYTADLDPRAVIASRWRRPEHHEHANIVVRHAFWAEPGRWDEVPGVEAAPPLLRYGDLLASNDPRQREIAGALRREL